MNRSEGIMIFKDTMEYLIDGLLTPEQYAELTKLIYYTKWGNGVDEKSITDKQVLLIWKTLKHSVLKSVKNAKNYENSKSQQDMQPNTEFDSEVENKPNKTVITAEYPNPQPKAESPSEGQESGKNEVLEIKSSVPDVDDSDNDFRYAQTDPYENPELSFLLDDDEFEKFEEERKNNEIIHKIICKDMDGNVNAEYVDDIVMVLKKAIKDGIVDWSVITDGVNSISIKYKKSKMEVHGLVKMVLSDMQAA